MFDQVLAWMEEDGWPTQLIDGRTAVRTRVSDADDSWEAVAIVYENRHELIVYAQCGNSPDDRKAAVAEYITRANYGLPLGNFEMDYSDGEVRYKTGIDVEGGDISPHLIHNVFYANASTTGKYIPGLRTVFEGADPAEAVRLIEALTRKDQPVQ